MAKIATYNDLYFFQATNQPSLNKYQCPTSTNLKLFGVNVSGSYKDNQLVEVSDIADFLPLIMNVDWSLGSQSLYPYVDYNQPPIINISSTSSNSGWQWNPYYTSGNAYFNFDCTFLSNNGKTYTTGATGKCEVLYSNFTIVGSNLSHSSQSIRLGGNLYVGQSTNIVFKLTTSEAVAWIDGVSTGSSWARKFEYTYAISIQ